MGRFVRTVAACWGLLAIASLLATDFSREAILAVVYATLLMTIPALVLVGVGAAVGFAPWPLVRAGESRRDRWLVRGTGVVTAAIPLAIVWLLAPDGINAIVLAIGSCFFTAMLVPWIVYGAARSIGWIEAIEPGTCTECGYRLDGASGGRCPECGCRAARPCAACGYDLSAGDGTRCPECGVTQPDEAA